MITARPYLLLFLALAVPLLAQTLPEPIVIPPPAPPAPYLPFPGLPPLALDEANNGVGVAQQLAREQGVQGRVLWVDGLANIDRLNTPEKVRALVRQVKDAGFNTVVLDVKPIPGYTLYPSKIAPRMTEWRGATLTAAMDPLAELVQSGHAAGLQVLANVNTFSEGHRWVGKGPGYEHPEWLTTYCEPQVQIIGMDGLSAMPVVQKMNGQPVPDGSLLLATTLADQAPRPGAVAVIFDDARRVVNIVDGAVFGSLYVPVPRGGAVLIGENTAADFLRQNARAGLPLQYRVVAAYPQAQQAANNGVPLWTNPNNPAVQQRLLDILQELVTTYAVDGVVFDDRMRFAAINTDMSDDSRKAFEQYVGKPLTWPDDVFRFEIGFPSLTRRVIPGPYYDAWLVWRATTIRNWLARAVVTVKTARPGTTVGVYVGSWYGEYAAYGSNWAAEDFQAGFRFLTDAYRRTGYAQLLDWLCTGCYYTVPTLADALANGGGLGTTIEAAGQLSNRAANNGAWVYAGISLDRFDNNPDGLTRALQAAAATTQGVMVFDLSHKIDQFWPVFKQAFAQPAAAPHATPLMDEVRKRVATRKQAGVIDPPVIVLQGASGVGL
jgi:uncharacterized lipoprotein YddW (UPF0748 family)